MSEAPLFQNTDEQESEYAPQDASEAVDQHLAGPNNVSGTGALPIPGPGASGAIHNMGQVSSSGTSPAYGAGAQPHDKDDEDSF